MLNYIAAELYKLRRHKALYIGTGLLLALECLVFHLEHWDGGIGAYSGEMLLAFFEAALFLGAFIAPIFAVMAFDDQYGNGTLKNEIVYGIPRHRIYFGKLLAGWTAGTVVALLAAGAYLLLAALVARPEGGAAGVIGRGLFSLFGHWLTWLSAYSFTFFLLMTLRGTGPAVVTAYLFTLVAFPLSLVGFVQGTVAPWLCLVFQLLYTAPAILLMEGVAFGITVIGEDPVFWMQPALDAWGEWAGLALYAVGVCLLWTVGLSLLGWFIFRRREIK